MILYVDKLQPDDFGGTTKDIEKIRHILYKFNIDINKLKNSHTSDSIPTCMFHAGRYIAIVQFNQTFTTGSLAFINFKVDLSIYIDAFADTFTPKVVAGFYEMQKTIQQKDANSLNLVELTDEPLISQTISQN